MYPIFLPSPHTRILYYKYSDLTRIVCTGAQKSQTKHNRSVEGILRLLGATVGEVKMRGAQLVAICNHTTIDAT